MKSRGIEWISGVDGKFAENLDNGLSNEMNKRINNRTVSEFWHFIILSFEHLMFRCCENLGQEGR